ncbi:MAG: hypothetical protein WA705_08855 [Candidatus Ozemobacteraceae bacterium]
MEKKLINFAELNEKGWTLVSNVLNMDSLVSLGKMIGIPVLAPNGELVKEIRRFLKNSAPANSQSSIYGTGVFPLHTNGDDNIHSALIRPASRHSSAEPRNHASLLKNHFVFSWRCASFIGNAHPATLFFGAQYGVK